MDPEGYVVVNWIGGQDSKPGKHRPHELYKVESEGEDSESENSSGSDNTSGSEDWETASEDGHGEADDENSENRPNLIISPVPPSQDEEPSSPSVDNVDVEALNNANNVENMSVETGDCDAGIIYVIVMQIYCILQSSLSIVVNNIEKY